MALICITLRLALYKVTHLHESTVGFKGVYSDAYE